MATWLRFTSPDGGQPVLIDMDRVVAIDWNTDRPGAARVVLARDGGRAVWIANSVAEVLMMLARQSAPPVGETGAGG